MCLKCRQVPVNTAAVTSGELERKVNNTSQVHPICLCTWSFKSHCFLSIKSYLSVFANETSPTSDTTTQISARSITSDATTDEYPTYLGQPSFVATFATSERAAVVGVAFAGGRHQWRILIVNKAFVTRLGGVNKRVWHVVLGQTVHCTRRHKHETTYVG